MKWIGFGITAYAFALAGGGPVMMFLVPIAFFVMCSGE